MGEFVEHSLEGLLPTFEQLSYVQLFTEPEVTAFIKRCRQFEYRLNKHEKTPRDFLLYADYLCDFLTLLKARRAKMQYWEKKKLIDDPMRKKVASIYRRAADRFQGDIRLWEKLIHFLNKNSMRRELSAAYTRALQIHGKNEKLRRDFALWLFFSAASPQNARTQILTSLRLLPQSATLYVAFFTIEIHFVDKVLKRRKFLTEGSGSRGPDSGEGDTDRVYDEEVEDAVMNLDVAKAVVEQALSAVPNSEASGMLMEMWKECSKVEVPNIEKIRSFIMDELKKFDNEDTRLFELELAADSGKSKFDLYEEALKKTSTERMHRLYLQWLRDTEPRDAFVDHKIIDVYRGLCDGGWMNDKDWTELESAMHDFPDQFDTDYIAKCLEKRPRSAVMWDVYLEKCIDNGHMSSDDFKDTCNRALEKVDPDENFPIWQHAIDYSIMHAPQETEQTFKDALKYANASVASRIKILFVEYLNELFNEGKLTAERLRERIMELVNNKPNRAEFYCALYRKEIERPKPDTKFAGFIIKTAVMEKDGVSVEAVILYGKWALAYDPAKFHFVHQTGLKLFEGPELEEFLTKWTRLLQDAATSEIEEEKDIQETTDVEVDKDVAPVKQEKQCQCECEKSKSARKGNKRKRKSEKRNSKKVKEILLNAD